MKSLFNVWCLYLMFVLCLMIVFIKCLWMMFVINVDVLNNVCSYVWLMFDVDDMIDWIIFMMKVFL